MYSWCVGWALSIRSRAEIGGADVRDARVRAVGCSVGKVAPSKLVRISEESRTPYEQHKEKGSVAPGVAILLDAARWSGMNVSATRRVTTIRGSAPVSLHGGGSALWWRLAHATCN